MRKIFTILLTILSISAYAQMPAGGTKLPKILGDSLWGTNGAFSPTYDGTFTIKDTLDICGLRDSTLVFLGGQRGRLSSDTDLFWLSPSTKELSLFSSPYKTVFPGGYDKYSFSIINNTAGTNRVMQYQSFGGGAIWHSRAAGGTQASPTPLLAGGQILSWGFQPWGSRFFGSVAAMIVRVRQNVSATNDTASTSITFEVTPLNAGDNARDTILLLIADTMQVEGSIVVEKHISIDSALRFKSIRTSTSATTNVTTGDLTILCDATGAAITVNLPAAASNKGRILNVKKIDVSGNTVTLDADGGELIDGATTQVISTQWSNIQIQCDGTSWFIL